MCGRKEECRTQRFIGIIGSLIFKHRLKQFVHVEDRDDADWVKRCVMLTRLIELVRGDARGRLSGIVSSRL